jgi:uncharacterized protein (TIGR00297 family)
MPARAAAGLVAASIIALLAWRARSLTASGAIAAALVGTASVAAGWGWGALLVGYFVASTLLSRLGAEGKARRTSAVVEKGGARDAVQVLANGGLFAALACVSSAAPLAGAAAAGALAAATADTWATEVGTLLNATPRSVRTGRVVPPGTSGGMSLPGTLALAGGALAIAICARASGLEAATLAVVAGGVTGAMADTLLGATVQARRWCSRCERATERRVHDCGTATTRAGGLAWLDNDAVNFGATAVGAGVAALVAAATAP